MSPAGRFISRIDDLAIAQDADARRTAADVDDGAVADAQDSRSGRRFIHNFDDFQVRPFNTIGDTADVAIEDARWDSRRRLGQGDAQFFF